MSINSERDTMFTITQGIGTNFAAPDVCLVPAAPSPVPTPLVNIQMSSNSSPVVRNVKINFMPVLNKRSMGKLSMGDEPGTAGGGVVSHRFKGETKYMVGSVKCKIGGAPAVRSFTPTGQNCMGATQNCPGMAVAPSQIIMMIMV